jgi:hypothetical protein
MKQVKCGTCGWVHFTQTAEKCREYVVTSSGRLKDEDFEHCFKCGASYMNFVPAKQGDCPVGSTIQPIKEYKND